MTYKQPLPILKNLSTNTYTDPPESFYQQMFIPVFSSPFISFRLNCYRELYRGDFLFSSQASS